MAPYGRDYSEDFGYGQRPGMWGRGYWGSSARADGWEGRPYFGDYDAPLRGPGPMVRHDRPVFGSGFAYGYGADYPPNAFGRGYKSRWQTDYGDPYRDRIRHTPMRMVREDSHRFSGSSGYGHDYDVRPYPVSYRSYEPRGGYDAQFGIRTGRLPYEQTGWSWPL